MTRASAAGSEVLVRVAQLFYEHSLTQEEIGRRLHLTRWKVGRLLEEARATGVVRIEIVHALARQHAAEQALIERYGLAAAIVVPQVADKDGLVVNVARAAAHYLSDLRPSPKLLGVSWGRTLELVTAAIPPGWSRGVHVVQLNGGLSRSQHQSFASDVVFGIAERGPGTATLLQAPAIVERAGTRTALQSDASISRVLDLARSADALLFSLGSMSANSVLVESGYLTADDMEALLAAGACGDLLGHFIDEKGEPVDSGLEARTVGLHLGDIRKAKLTIAAVAGPAKHKAALAAITAGLCTVLVTDHDTARFLLEAAL